MLPLKDTVPARSFPVVNWLLIAANVVLFFVELSLGPDAEALIAALGVVPARLLTSPTPDQLATLVTSMFLHGAGCTCLATCWPFTSSATMSRIG